MTEPQPQPQDRRIVETAIKRLAETGMEFTWVLRAIAAIRPLLLEKPPAEPVKPATRRSWAHRLRKRGFSDDEARSAANARALGYVEGDEAEIIVAAAQASANGAVFRVGAKIDADGEVPVTVNGTLWTLRRRGRVNRENRAELKRTAQKKRMGRPPKSLSIVRATSPDAQPPPARTPIVPHTPPPPPAKRNKPRDSRTRIVLEEMESRIKSATGRECKTTTLDAHELTILFSSWAGTVEEFWKIAEFAWRENIAFSLKTICASWNQIIRQMSEATAEGRPPTLAEWQNFCGKMSPPFDPKASAAVWSQLSAADKWGDIPQWKTYAAAKHRYWIATTTLKRAT